MQIAKTIVIDSCAGLIQELLENDDDSHAAMCIRYKLNYDVKSRRKFQSTFPLEWQARLGLAQLFR